MRKEKPVYSWIGEEDICVIMKQQWRMQPEEVVKALEERADLFEQNEVLQARIAKLEDRIGKMDEHIVDLHGVLAMFSLWFNPEDEEEWPRYTFGADQAEAKKLIDYADKSMEAYDELDD